MNIPKIIHFTIPKSPSADQLKAIEVSRELHPGWKIEVWQDPVDRASFKLSKYWDKTNSGAQLADLIRLEVVLMHGGFYLDSDIMLRKSLDALRGYPFVIVSEDGKVATNAFFGAVPQSPVVEHLVETLNNHEVDWKAEPHLTTGPAFFARELKWRDDVTVLPRETFYPYSWHEKAKAPRLWTYGTHLWRYSWNSITRERQPLRSIVRSARRRLATFRHRLFIRTRYSLLGLRQLFAIGRVAPYTAHGVICVQTVHGPTIYLLGEDASVTPQVALHGTYEFREERFIQRILRPGDWAIDVGANVGIFSVLCAKLVGPFGRVYCYEPNPLPAELLRKSLLMNWFHDRAEVRQKALGSEIHTQRLRFSKGRLGDATLTTAASAGAFDRSAITLGALDEIEVQVSTLDADFPVDLPIRLLKVDVEGFEHEFLRGAARLLENHCIDILMLECLQEVFGDAWNEFVSELEKIIAFGYEPFTLTRSSKLRKMTFKQLIFGERSRNIIFVSKHATATINELS